MSEIFRQHIPETIVPGKRLGRHIHHDPMSLSYPAQQARRLTSVRHQSAGLPLDQGDVGSCTANALVGALNSVPHWQQGQPTLAEPDALHAYSLEEQLIGFGPYPPNDNGGSGTEVCTAGRRLGWLSAYQTAQGIEQALRALALRPVITGVNWYDSFDTPDSNGLVIIAEGAQVRGGHEICADEIIVPAGVEFVTSADIAANLDRILVGLWQSWGLGYGLQGRFYWTAATWDRLLQEGGDVTVPRTSRGWIAKPQATVDSQEAVA